MNTRIKQKAWPNGKFIVTGVWQNCPHCNGTGIEQYGTFNTSMPRCTVCDGKKIISAVNGLPPQ